MKFTQQGKKVDQQIKKYLDAIVEAILKKVPEAKSILLGGGFGRGEGSAEIKKGRIIPQNDFEIFLITEKNLKEGFVNQVANKAAQKLDIGNVGADFYNFEREVFANTFYIDMKAIQINKLPYLLPMFRYFELKNVTACLVVINIFLSFLVKNPTRDGVNSSRPGLA